MAGSPTSTYGVDATRAAADTLAAAITESFRGVADVLRTTVVPQTKSVTDAMKQLGDVMKGTIAPVLRAVTDAFAKLGTQLRPLADTIRFTVTNTIERARDALRPLADTTAALFSNVVERVGESLGPLAKRVREAMYPVTDTVSALFGNLRERIGESLEKNLKPVTARLGNFFAGIVKSLPVGGGGYVAGGKAGGALGGLASLAGGIGKFAGGVGIAVGAVAGLGAAIGGLVAKASPAHFERFQLVMGDVAAVVGRALIPVFEVVTATMRAFGDTLATFVKDIGSALGTVASAVMPILLSQFELFGTLGQALGSVLKSVAPAFAAIGAVINSVFKALQPIFALVIDTLGGVLVTVLGNLAKALEAIAPYIVAAVTLIGQLAATIAGWVRQLLEWVGIVDAAKPGTEAGKSVNAAARNVSQSDPRSVIAEAQRAAYGAGFGEKPEVKLAKSIDDKVKEILTVIKALPREFAEALKGYADKKVEDVKTVAADVTSAVTPEVTGVTGIAAGVRRAQQFWGSVKANLGVVD